MVGAAVSGMGPLVTRYYSTDDATERFMLRSIMERGIEIAGEVREDQAERIIAALDRALNKKSSHRHGG